MGMISQNLALHLSEGLGIGGWQEQLESVCETVKSELAVDGLGIYFLRLRTGSLELQEFAGDVVPLAPIDLSPYAPAPTGECEQTAKRLVLGAEPWARCRGQLFVPVRRGSTTTVLVQINDREAMTLGADDVAALRQALSVLRPIYLERRLTKLVFHMRKSLPYRADQNAFLDELGSLVLSASGMPYAALRTLSDDGRYLNCVRSWGFGRSPRTKDLSWPTDRFAPFAAAAAGKVDTVSRVRGTDLEEINSVVGLDKVESFVTIPITIEGEPYGVLSVAATCSYDFNGAEQSALESLGNSVGVAFRHYQDTHGKILSAEDTETSTMSAALEIASSARHEAKDVIDALIDEVSDCRTNRRDLDLSETEDDLLLLSNIIDKIRLASVPPSYETRTVLLTDVWDDAINQVTGRLKHNKVDHRINFASGKSPTVKIYYEWFRLSLVHLLLNSIDAYTEKGFGTRKPLKSGRLITLHVERFGPKDTNLTMRYSDNATGISKDMLRTPKRYEHLSFDEAIFVPGASTKYDGDEPQSSGHGLHLIRRAMKEHGGGARLVDYRGGVTFELTLPRSRVIL